MIEPSNEASTAIIRRAAGRLAGLDANLPAATERLLQGAPRRRSLDAGTSVALASLLLSLVQFGWTVYQDQLRQKEKAEARDSLVQRLRGRIETDGHLSPTERDLVVEVVAEEILG